MARIKVHAVPLKDLKQSKRKESKKAIKLKGVNFCLFESCSCVTPMVTVIGLNTGGRALNLALQVLSGFFL